jgi:hypothetical protein
VILRRTSKLLNLLGRSAVTLVDAPSSEDDWFANLLWLDRRKCLQLPVDALGRLAPEEVRLAKTNDSSTPDQTPIAAARAIRRRTRSSSPPVKSAAAAHAARRQDGASKTASMPSARG